MYLIYDQKTSRILSRESNRPRQHAAYMTMSAAKAALTRMQKKFAQRNAADAAQGPMYTAAIAESDYYYKNIEKFVTRKNMMSGKEYTESGNTPSYMSPSSESYWSM